MPSERRFSVDRVAPLAIALASFVYLGPLGFAAPAHRDTARDLLIARDCVDAGRCHFAGPPTSVPGLTQGALWVHLLEAALAVHLRVASIERLAWLLLAASGAVAYGFARATLPPRAAAVGAGFYVVFAQWVSLYPTLWNPTLLPLPVAGSYYFLARHHSGGGRRALLLAAACVALSIEAHLVCLVLVPLGLVAVARRSDTPLRDVATFAGVVAVLAGCDAPRAWSDNLAALASGGGLVVAAGAGHAGFAPRYLAPVLPLLAVGAARLLHRWVRPARAWTDAIPVVGLALVAMLWVSALHIVFDCPAIPLWSLRDAERIAERLAADGVADSRDGLVVRGAYSQTLTSTVEALLPADLRAGSGTWRSLAVLKLPTNRLREWSGLGWETVPLGGGYFAAIRRDDAGLRFDELRCCAQPAGGARSTCVPATLPSMPAAHPFVDAFAYPSICPRRQGESSAGRSYVLPVGTAPRDTVYRVINPLPGFLEPPWRLDEESSTELGGAPALVLRRDVRGKTPPDDGWIPGVVEVPPSLADAPDALTRPRCALCVALEGWIGWRFGRRP